MSKRYVTYAVVTLCCHAVCYIIYNLILEYTACIALHDACRFCKKHLPAAMYTWPLSAMPTQSSLTTYCKLKAYRYSITCESDLFSG